MDNEVIVGQARQLLQTIKQLQQRVMVRSVSEFGAHCGDRDLTFPQMSMLMVIRDHGEMSLKDVANALGVSAPSASAMVDRLVERGALVRQLSARDRREVRISVSGTGLEVLDELEGQLLQALMDLLEAIGPEWARRWCEVYDEIQRHLDAVLRDAPQAQANGGRVANRGS